MYYILAALLRGIPDNTLNLLINVIGSQEVQLMNAFTRSIMQIVQGAAKAFTSFPAAIACAFAFTLVTIVRIYLDWPANKDYNFLFNCLHWSFALAQFRRLTAKEEKYDKNQ